MFCRYCGKELPDTAEFCPYCGKKITIIQSENKKNSSDKKTSSKMKSFLIIVLILFLIGGSGIFLHTKSIENKSKEAYNSAIVLIDKGELERASEILKPYYKDSNECATLYFYVNAKEAEKKNQVEVFDLCTSALTSDKEKWGKYSEDINRMLDNKKQILQKMKLQRGF